MTTPTFRSTLIQLMAERNLDKTDTTGLTGDELQQAIDNNEGLEEIHDLATQLHDKLMGELKNRMLKIKPAKKSQAENRAFIENSANAIIAAEEEEEAASPVPLPAAKPVSMPVTKPVSTPATSTPATSTPATSTPTTSTEAAKPASTPPAEEAEKQIKPVIAKKRKSKKDDEDPDAEPKPKRAPSSYAVFNGMISAAHKASSKGSADKSSTADKEKWTSIRETWDNVKIHVGDLDAMTGAALDVLTRAKAMDAETNSTYTEFMAMKGTEQTMTALLTATQKLLVAVDQKVKPMVLAPILWAAVNKTNPLGSSAAIAAASDISEDDEF
jgi:hypothetical protein